MIGMNLPIIIIINKLSINAGYLGHKWDMQI